VTKRPLATSIAVLAVLCAWLFSASLFSGKVLAPEDLLLANGAPFSAPAGYTHPSNPLLFDAAWVLHPDMLEVRRQLRDFNLPIWTRTTGAGQPLLASQQNAAFFPLNWIADVFPFWQSLEWVAALKVLLAAIGMLLLLRGLALARIATVFGAVSYAFSMALVLWLEHPHSNSYSLLPWVLFATDALIRVGGRRRTAALGLAVGLTMLAGQPESAALVMTAAVLFGIVRLVEVGRADGRKVALNRLGLFAAGTVLGVGLGAIMLLPFQEMLGVASSKTRSDGPGPRASAWTFFMPELWGRPDKFETSGGPLNFQERSVYFGALPLMLAVGGLAARQRAAQIGFALVFIVGLALAIDIPVLSDVLKNLPVLDRITRLRGLILCEFAGAGLAAYGLHELIEGDARARIRLAIGAGVAAIPPLIWLLGHTNVWGHWSDAFDQLPVQSDAASSTEGLAFATVLRWFGLAIVGAALIGIALRRRSAVLVIAALIVAVTALDMVSLDRGYHPATPLAWADPPISPGVSYARARLDHYRLIAGNEFGPDLSARYNVPGADIHALPALQRRNDAWFTAGGDGYLQRLWLGINAGRLANLTSARYVYFGPLKDQHNGQWKPTPYLPLYENAFPLPRAFMAYNWTPAADRVAAVKAFGGRTSVDDFQRPVIEGVGTPGQGDSEPAEFTIDGDTRVALKVDAKQPGYLILADTYYPGWKAKVDGKETKIHPANVWFRAVAVPAGTHNVEFVYRPKTVIFGALISALAGLLIVLGLVLPERRR
jgi:hypothetical protein